MLTILLFRHIRAYCINFAFRIKKILDVFLLWVEDDYCTKKKKLILSAFNNSESMVQMK